MDRTIFAASTAGEAADASEPQPASDWRSALVTKRAADNDKAKVRVHRVRKPKAAATAKRKAREK